MNSYERSFLGDIVLVKHLVFKNNNTGKYEMDHAYYTGRPCIIIYTDNEYDYFLPLTKGGKCINNYLYDYFIIDNKEDILFVDDKSVDFICYANLRNIYKIPISFRKRKSKVKYSVYKDLIEEVKRKYKIEEIDKIVKKYSLLKK